MDVADFEAAKRYVEFDMDSAAHLRLLHPIALPHLERIAEDFYDAAEKAPAAAIVITGGREQIERLKRTLVEWMDSLLAGPHDAAYLDARSRIGRVHVRIALPQEFMFTALNRIRIQLSDIARDSLAPDLELSAKVLGALHKIMDLELMIMIDTYREHLLEKMRATERLAVIGQLAASIGHELRNPLGTIESSLFLLRQRLAKLQIDDPQLTKHHAKIENQVKHCGKTINNLLDLARDRPPRRQRTVAATLVTRAAEQAALPSGVSVKMQDLDGLTVDADPDDMLHVLVNLLTNAAQAMPSGGTIRVSGSRWKGGTVLKVADEGPGIPVEIQHRVFEALFTTKARGTGLGLALARRILYAHGGEIDLESSQYGAVFRLWIPDMSAPLSPLLG
jgi:signal transduction histidine kinase